MARVSSPRNPSSRDLFRVRLTHRVRSFPNASAPFNIEEHNVLYKSQKYLPWNFNEYRDWTVRIGFLPFNPHFPAFGLLTISLI